MRYLRLKKPDPVLRAGEENRTPFLSLGRLVILNRWTTVDDYGRSPSRWTTVDVHGRIRTPHERAMNTLDSQ
jgi:hypothetical protein